MLVPGWNGMPGGVSEAISVKPDGVSSWLCMTLSSKPGGAWPKSPNVLTDSSPPKVAL